MKVYIIEEEVWERVRYTHEVEAPSARAAVAAVRRGESEGVADNGSGVSRKGALRVLRGPLQKGLTICATARHSASMMCVRLGRTNDR